MNRNIQLPPWKAIAPDLLALALGLALAWFLDWQTTDLVWSLWLGSLVLGYLTILSTIAAGVYVGLNAIFHPEFPKARRPLLLALGAAGALFLLGFFSLHFCAFHAGHAGFLSLFFPLEGMPPDAFFDAFMNPFRLWQTAIRHVLPLYGVFLVPAILAERAHVFAAPAAAIRAVNEGRPAASLVDKVLPRSIPAQDFGALFSRPYVNVIRMHLLIFFFAASHALHVDSFLVYAAVSLVYFFPWAAFRAAQGPGRAPLT